MESKSSIAAVKNETTKNGCCWVQQKPTKEVVSDVESYPHPSFPSPDAPTVAEVAAAKAKLVDMIRSSKPFEDAIRRISLQRTSASQRFNLLCVDKVGTSMIGKNLSTFSLVNHETAWPELLEKVQQAVGFTGLSGNILVLRDQESVSIQLVWG
jgi:hypothetical protein